MSKHFNEMREYAKELYSLGEMMTASQTMMIAAQMVHNRILEEGLITGKDNPGAIEAIAISLGMNDREPAPIIQAIDSLEERLMEISSHLESMERVFKRSTISNE
jgi:hypothetical protein